MVKTLQADSEVNPDKEKILSLFYNAICNVLTSVLDMAIYYPMDTDYGLQFLNECTSLPIIINQMSEKAIHSS